MNLSDAIKIYVGESEVSGVHQGDNQAWASGGDSFLYGSLLTQIDAGAISSQSMGIGVPSVPTVVALTSLIAETPVGSDTDLSVPSVPSITVSTLVETI